MWWIGHHGEYERQQESLRRRSDFESPEGLPRPGWEIDDIDPSRNWEPDALPRPADLLLLARHMRRR